MLRVIYLLVAAVSVLNGIRSVGVLNSAESKRLLRPGMFSAVYKDLDNLLKARLLPGLFS
jgi:hypothetical protein